MKRIALYIAACGVAAAAAAFSPAGAPAGEAVAPLRVVEGNNMMLVDAAVDGTPCTLVFDTGATHTSLDEAFARRALPLAEPREVVVAGATNVRQKPLARRVRTLLVGNAEFTDFSAMCVDLSHLSRSVGTRVDGVLGMNVISRTPALVSAARGAVVFNPAESKLAGFGKSVKSVSPDPLEIVIGLRIAGRPVPVLVDSGASFSFMNAANWPKGTNSVEIAAADANGRGGRSVARGAPAILPLGMPVRITPLVGDDAPNCIGAETLKLYDLYIEKGAVRFRPAAECPLSPEAPLQEPPSAAPRRPNLSQT